MSSTTIKKIIAIAMENFESEYPSLVNDLRDLKMKINNWNELPEDTRGPSPVSNFDVLCNTAGVPIHNEVVHNTLDKDWKKNCVVLDEVLTPNEKNVVYLWPFSNMELNVLSMSDTEVLEKLCSGELKVFITASFSAKMLFINFKIDRSLVEKNTKTSYILERTNLKDGKVISYPYYTNRYVPPTDFYRLISRDFTNNYCGWISPYGSEHNFISMYEKVLNEKSNVLVVRIM